MTQPRLRRIGASLAALVIVGGLASGCPAGDWRYDIPPAAGVVEDAGPVKARNIMVLADSDGTGLLLGSLFSSEPVELEGAVVAAQQQDGSYADPVEVDVNGTIGVGDALDFGGTDSIVEGADLVAGMLAEISLQFSDGTSLTVETPVASAQDRAYADAWAAAQS